MTSSPRFGSTTSSSAACEERHHLEWLLDPSVFPLVSAAALALPLRHCRSAGLRRHPPCASALVPHSPSIGVVAS
ncbi:unnamed protein product [Urochloa humidicola]